MHSHKSNGGNHVPNTTGNNIVSAVQGGQLPPYGRGGPNLPSSSLSSVMTADHTAPTAAVAASASSTASTTSSLTGGLGSSGMGGGGIGGRWVRAG